MTEPIITQLKAIAHPARFAILRALAAGERNVGEIEGATAIGQPLLSQQLSVLRKADLVQTRRAAKLVFYRIDPEALAGIAQGIAALAGQSGSGTQAKVASPPPPIAPQPAPAKSASTKSTGGAAVFARIG